MSMIPFECKLLPSAATICQGKNCVDLNVRYVITVMNIKYAVDGSFRYIPTMKNIRYIAREEHFHDSITVLTSHIWIWDTS